VFSSIAAVGLMKNEKVDDVVHVVVLDAERLASQVSGRRIEDGQLKDDQPRRPNFKINSGDLHHARFADSLLLHPLKFPQVDLVRVSTLDKLQIFFVTLPETSR
jgi:hypothetical protein